jgi:small subunit ribosomal protein S2
MAVISMKALLESGVHFGHRTNKWNPAMKQFIFTERNGIHIIDLQQTVKSINTAYAAVRDVVAGGGIVMFVGTKRQAQETVHDEAIRCGMPYVTERWLGGMLTNWSTMYQRIQELERMEKLVTSGEVERLTKKEGLLIQRQITRLNIRLSGVRSITRVPDMVFIVDVMREESAVHEANLLDIPVVALVDTNCDPSNVDFVIPSNDDAIRAIKLLVAKMADAVLEGKAMRKDEELEMMEQVKAEAGAMADADQKSPRAIDMDEDMDDDLLLGDATLAKLAPTHEESEEETQADEDESEEEPVGSEEPGSGEPAEEPVVAEEPVAEPAEEPVVAEEPVAEPAEESVVAEEPGSAEPAEEPVVAEEPVAEPAEEPAVDPAARSADEEEKTTPEE